MLFRSQLQPKRYKPSPLPGLDSSKDVSTPGPWLELIQSSSHRRRIEGQRGLVRLASLLPDRAEALAKELYSLAENEATPLKSRIAALFGIAIIRDQWIRGGQEKQVASRILGLLTGLANRPTIAPWAIRALGDAQTWETHEATDVFKRGLQSEESRTLLETLVALDKLGTNARSKTEGTTQVRSQDESSDWSVRIAPHLSSPDATIRHLATRAIARLGAIDKCIAICSEQSETSLAFEHAVQALSLIHDPERVNQLINALDRVPAQVQIGRAHV